MENLFIKSSRNFRTKRVQQKAKLPHCFSFNSMMEMTKIGVSELKDNSIGSI